MRGQSGIQLFFFLSRREGGVVFGLKMGNSKGNTEMTLDTMLGHWHRRRFCLFYAIKMLFNIFQF